MNYRPFPRTGWQVSEVGFGAWGLGGAFGHVDEGDALAALRAAIDSGVNFVDTADVYGLSERLVGRALAERRERVYVVTKAGRRLNPMEPEGFNRANLSAFVESSLRNLRVECLDLLLLHCPPTQVFYMPEVFGVLDDLVQAGKLSYYGASVEKVEEALKAIEFPNVAAIEIIYNLFRQRPADLFFSLAQQRQVGVIARVPLASGLLSGKMSRATQFAPDDHREYNRHGEYFDVGETFAGVDFETGLAAVERLRAVLPPGQAMAQLALRWILMNRAVTVVIPGAKNPEQAKSNALASDLPPFSPEQMATIQDIYDEMIRPQVHQRW